MYRSITAMWRTKSPRVNFPSRKDHSSLSAGMQRSTRTVRWCTLSRYSRKTLRSWICMALGECPRDDSALPLAHGIGSLRRRHVLLGLLGAFAEEVGFHLLHDELLVVLLPGLQAIFVKQHLHVLLPLLPRQLGHVVVDALPKFAIERRLVETFHFAAHLNALHRVCHVISWVIMLTRF